MKACGPLLVMALGSLLGCTSTAGSRAVLPVPAKVADYQPSNPLSQRTTGLLGRSVFRSGEGDAFQVLVEDLLVQPSSTAVSVPLSEAAVIETRSGEGEADIAGTHVQLKQGTVVAVSVGQSFDVQPRGGPVELRVVQIASR